jgi:hypothetical protein
VDRIYQCNIWYQCPGLELSKKNIIELICKIFHLLHGVTVHPVCMHSRFNQFHCPMWNTFVRTKLFIWLSLSHNDNISLKEIRFGQFNNQSRYWSEMSSRYELLYGGHFCYSKLLWEVSLYGCNLQFLNTS